MCDPREVLSSQVWESVLSAGMSAVRTGCPVPIAEHRILVLPGGHPAFAWGPSFDGLSGDWVVTGILGPAAVTAQFRVVAFDSESWAEAFPAAAVTALERLLAGARGEN